MGSRKNLNKGNPQNSRQSKSGKKSLSNSDFKLLQEMFVGISPSFINQVAQAHNNDVMQTGNYLIAYKNRISKNDCKQKKTNSSNEQQKNPSKEQQKNPSKDQKKNPLKEQKNPSKDQKKNPSKDQKKNLSKDQQKNPSKQQQPGNIRKSSKLPAPILVAHCSNSQPKSFSKLLQGPSLIKFTERNPRITGAIKKIPIKSPGELEVERVVNFINTGVKVIVLLRGLPGSGKSYLARLIFDRTVKSYEDTSPEYHIFSTDTFFEWLGNGQYKFNPLRLSEAHEWNRVRFCEALKRGISPVIVDNTNTMAWEMHPYVAEGMKHGYAIEVLEPFTPWAFKEYELSIKNIHDVPRTNIKQMLERYDRHLTGASLIALLNLQYVENNKPPQQRQFPKTPEYVVENSDNRSLSITEDNSSTTSTSSTSSTSDDSDDDEDESDISIHSIKKIHSKYRYLSNIIPQLKIEQLLRIILDGSTDPLWDFLSSKGYKQCQSVVNDNEKFDDLKLQIKHRYTRDELLNILPEEKRIILQRILEGIKEQRSTRKRNETNMEEEISTSNNIENRKIDMDEFINQMTNCTTEDLVVSLDDMKKVNNEEQLETKINQTSTTNDAIKEEVNDFIDWTKDWIVDDKDTGKGNDEKPKYTLLEDDDGPIFNTLPELLNEVPKTDTNSTNTLIEINEAEEEGATKKPFLPTFKNYLQFLNPEPQPLLVVEEHCEVQTTKTVSSITNPNTFSILDGKIILNDEECYILTTNSRDISEGCSNSVKYHLTPPKILKLDKSSMTHEDNFLEEESSFQNRNDENKHLMELFAMFPKIRKNFIRDIFDKCKGNFYWAVELLLDVEVDDDTKVEDSSEDESVEIIDNIDSKASPQVVDDGEVVILTEPDTVAFCYPINKKSTSHSENALKLKKQLEEQFIIDDSHYSEHCLKIRRLRHGEQTPSAEDVVKASESVSETSSNESDTEETDSNETEDSLDDDECLEMTLGFDFVNRLDAIFGKENSSYPDGLQPVIQVPKSIAQQLHLLWLESYYQQVCAHEERSEQMLKEDEEFARKLQEQENELSASGSQPQVPSIQEILNMEIDLEIAKRDDTTASNESYKDLASRMTRQKLYEMFPGILHDTVDDILENFNNKYEDTVNYLICIMGDSGITGEFSETMEDMFNKQSLSNQEKQLIEQAKQTSLQVVDIEHRPIIVVRESASSALSPSSPTKKPTTTHGDAEYYREIGQQQLRLRNDCLEKARNMYLRGLTSAALYYSELAQVHKNKYEQANQSAAIYFVNSHSQNHNNNTLLDLHYLFVAEALQVLDLFIDNHISQLQQQKSCITLNLITGRGARSAGGRARVKPAVLRRLKQRNLKYHFINPGLLKFKLRHYDVMTNSLH